MTQQPLNTAALRGAVDLSSLAQRPAAGGGPATGGGSAGATSDDALVVEVVDQQQFAELVNASVRYPVIMALYATSQPGTRTPVDEIATAVREQGGKVQLAAVDIDKVPEIGQAFHQLGEQAAQQGQLPPGAPLTTVAFLQGQPMPLPPLPDAAAARQIVEELVKVAISNGVAGRVPGDHDAAGADDEASETDDGELPPLHQEAYDAIERGDYAAAISAYERAVAENPQDDDAKLGLGQVKLLQRTEGVDLQQARAAAADAPQDIPAQLVVADLDVLGGHVEDAFARLIDLVRVTTGDERNSAREHLIGLFDIVGATDPRVKSARTALMSALY